MVSKLAVFSVDRKVYECMNRLRFGNGIFHGTYVFLDDISAWLIFQVFSVLMVGGITIFIYGRMYQEYMCVVD